jgi:diguanylate cyclase (GGDEF)-like protein/PAS domain S-box-containing protein
MPGLQPSPAARWGGAAVASAIGLAVVALVAFRVGHAAPSAWFQPAGAAVAFVLLALSAVMELSEAWVRADRRSLAWAGSLLGSGVLFLLAAVPMLTTSGAAIDPARLQAGQAMYLLAELASAALLLYASVVPELPRVPGPDVVVPMTAVGAILGPAAVAGFVYVVAPRLPVLVSAGGYTLADHLISAVPVPLLGAAGWLHWSDRTRDRAGGRALTSLVLLLFAAVGGSVVTDRFSPGWYGVTALQLGAFTVVAFGLVTSHHGLLRVAGRQAFALTVLGEAVHELGAATEPGEIAGVLSANLTRLVGDPGYPEPRVTVYHVDGPVASKIGGPPLGNGRVAEPLAIEADHLLRSAVATGEIAVDEDGRVAAAINWRGGVIGVMEITYDRPGWHGPDTLSVVQKLADVAGMGLATLDVLSDLESVEGQNRAILGAVRESYVSTTLDGVVVGWNGHATDMFGWQPSHVVGRDLVELLVAPGDRERCRGELRRNARRGTRISSNFEFELSAVHRCGTPVQVGVTGWRYESGGAARIGLLITDVSSRKTAESRLSRRATHDPLTELPNRSLTLEFLTRALHTGNHGGERVAAIFVDLNHFARINETLGPEGGDRVLATVAYRLLGVTRPGDVVGRVGGDEFAVLCRRVQEPSEVQMVAARIHRVLSDPIQLLEGDVTISASVGVAFSEPESTAQELLRCSFRAMEAARAAQGDHGHAPEPNIGAGSGSGHEQGDAVAFRALTETPV